MEAIMPNLSAIPQLLIFLVAVVVVKFLILDPVTEVLKGRSARIDGAERDASKMREDGEKLNEDYRQKILEARSQAKRERAERHARALAEEKNILGLGREAAQEKMQGVVAEIRKESEAARNRLIADAERISQMLAEKLLGRQIS